MDDELVITENKDETVTVEVKPTFRQAEVKIAPLNNYFDIDRKTTNKETQQLEGIMEFLEQDTDTKTEGNIYMALRNIEEKLTSPKLGETRIGKIFNYIKILQQIKEDEKERDSHLR